MSKELIKDIQDKLSLIVVGNVATAEQVGAVNQAVEALRSSLGIAADEPDVNVEPEAPAVEEVPVAAVEAPSEPVVEETAPVEPEAA